MKESSLLLLLRLKELGIIVRPHNGSLKINAPKGRLTPALLKEINDQKKDILAFLQNMKHPLDDNPIKPVEKKEYYLQSSAQKRLFFLHRLNPESTSYNMPQRLILGMKFSKEKLEPAIKKLIARHESLRTSFEMIGEIPVQKICEQVDFSLEVYEALENDVEGIIKKFIRPFNLSRAPLLRAGLIMTAAANPILLFDLHHIITDEVSQRILEQEFAASWSGKSSPPLKFHYKDYAEWQSNPARQQLKKQQESYWLKIFPGELPALNIPYDYPAPLMQSSAGAAVNFTLNRGITKNIKTNKAFDATLYVFILSSFYILLAMISRQEDIIVGAPVDARAHSNLENIIGMFIHTIAVRNFPIGDKTFKEFLNEVKKHTVDALMNQEYPFEELVSKIAVHRDPGRNPLFDVMFNLMNRQEYGGDIPDTAELSHPQHTEVAAKFDLNLLAIDCGDILLLKLEYKTALFKPQTIERFITYFVRIISSVSDNPAIKLSQIEIMSGEEKKRILDDFNNAGTPHVKTKTICRLFEEQAEQTPAAVAVVCKNKNLSYRELNRKAGSMAGLLRREGVGKNSIIGIMVEPSLPLSIGILAILKAGGAYLPIDPELPAARISYMLDDSRAGILLTGAVQSESFNPAKRTNIIFIEENIHNNQHPHLKNGNDPDSPVYMIYTSGTTGKPRGTLITDRNLVNYVSWFGKELNLTANDRSLLTSSYAYDLGYSSIYPAILNGGQLHIILKETYLNPEDLLAYIREHKISYLKMTPSLFNTISGSEFFLKESCATLRVIVLGGEQIRPHDAAKARSICDRIKIMNHYGPTETTIGSTAQFIDFNRFREYKIEPTIGKPINNTAVYILDGNLKPTPSGAAGELCIGGAGVGAGYVNNPELTADKFIRNPFKEKGVLYRTGDLAKWQDTGYIKLLGRMDHQVKIRGYRIELKEIENQLLKLQEVKEAVVTEEKNEKGQYICSYVVLEQDTTLSANRLKEQLSIYLPTYMIPSYFVFLEKIPLTPNGKIDRKALLLPETNVQGSDYIAPRNIIENKLVEIWSHVLGIEPENISINADFFSLGGHSLNILSVCSQINKIFGVKINLTQLFRKTTIREIHDLLSDSNLHEEPYILFNESKPGKIFFFPPLIGFGLAYVAGASYLENYAVYAFNFLDDEDIIKKYARLIIRAQRQGPYVLFGYSAGGYLAFAVAKELEKQGYHVAHLILLDSPKNVDNYDAAQENPELAENKNDGLDEIKKILKRIGLEHYFKAVSEKSVKYKFFIDTLEPGGIVAANIHLITSADTPPAMYAGWSNSTKKNYKVYEGFGNHENMLDSSFLEANMDIVNRLLTNENDDAIILPSFM